MSFEKTLETFLRRTREAGLSVEGVAVADERKVIAERREKIDIARNVYSTTKSFTAVAVGIAVDEGKLALTDRLADAFPEYVPEDAQPWLLQITLRDLLTMSSGFGRCLLVGGRRLQGTGSPDYVAYVMSQKVEIEPGTKFVYSNGDTHMALRMAEKAIGTPFGEFMCQRMFGPMGIGWPVWEHDPQGHPFGAAGLFLTLREMMKLGQLCLMDGVWNGQRIVSHEWLAQATSKQIDTVWNTPDGCCGYGYQFWMNPYPGSYRTDGAYGQLTEILPEQGLVVGVQCSESNNFDKLKPFVYDELLPEIIAESV